MTGRDVPDADMPNSFGQQGAGAGPESESAEALDALLAGALPPDDVATGQRPVADLLAALSAPPEPDELAGHGQMLAAFRQWAAGTASMPVNGHRGPASRARPASLARLATRARPASRARHASLARRAGNRGRGHRPVTALPAARAAAAAAVAAVVFGGLASAAYARVLPAPAQGFAHTVIGAPPPPRPAESPAGGPATPDAGGSNGALAVKLCTAYANARAHGSPAWRAAAFRSVAAAAGGPGGVAAYCATATRGGATGLPAPAASHSAGKPATPPGKPSVPPGKPATSPGKPSVPPGRPSALPTQAAHATRPPQATQRPTGTPSATPAQASPEPSASYGLPASDQFPLPRFLLSPRYPQSTPSPQRSP